MLIYIKFSQTKPQYRHVHFTNPQQSTDYQQVTASRENNPIYYTPSFIQNQKQVNSSTVQYSIIDVGLPSQ